MSILLLLWFIASTFYPELQPTIAWGALLLAGVAWWDDRYTLGPLWRLLSQIIAVAIAVWSLAPGLGFGLLIMTLMGVWAINLYNFMDGMDGFAGSMALWGFGFYAAVGLLSEHMMFALAAGVVMAGVLGFLYFNWPQARIFLGDVGSTGLGFLAFVFALWGMQAQILSPILAALVFAPFIVDASIVLLRRLLTGETVWHPHRKHYYQRWVLAGLSHRQVLRRAWGYMALAWGLAMAAYLGWLHLYQALGVAVIIAVSSLVVWEYKLARRIPWKSEGVD